ncbi:concanavalin A-like lectin/glucanase domain-containing protein [Earliella scabrosa]|nr:concanavalin A-like lectin/glucanase domain-containing protein [Earliella scabrosa]
MHPRRSLCYPTELALVLLAFLGLHAWGVSGQRTLQGNDCTAAGAYTLCQNLWGADTGVGTQSTTLDSASGNSVAWGTTYTWANSPNNVKSYPNVYHNTAKGMQLQDVVAAPTSWQWRYQSASDDLRADVAYDVWFGVPQSGDVASAASSYEIMIWLSARGGSVSSLCTVVIKRAYTHPTTTSRVYRVSGIGGVVAQNLQIGGHTWNLRHGPNGNWDVFSFITAEGDITDFRADLNDFFRYLVNEQGVARTQYIQAIQAGTEPFTGSAELVTTNFSVDVSTQETQPSSSNPPPPPPASSSSSSSSASRASTTATSSSTSSADEAPTDTSSETSAAPTNSDADSPAPTESAVGTAESRNPGGGQCRLQLPASRRLRRRSWIERVFQ